MSEREQKSASAPSGMVDGWFEEIFDREYADTFRHAYSDLRTQREVEGVLRTLEVASGALVVDCPCGFGRHAIRLAEAGLAVIGVDGAGAQIAAATANAGTRLAVSDHPTPGSLRFHRADYRRLGLANAVADAVVCLGSSLGYSTPEDDALALREFHRLLKPAGKLLLEVAHRDWAVDGGGGQHWSRFDDGRFLLRETSFDPLTSVAEVHFITVGTGAPALDRTVRVRLYTVTELLTMAQQAGFSNIECYAGFSGKPFSPDAQLVLVASR